MSTLYFLEHSGLLLEKKKQAFIFDCIGDPVACLKQKDIEAKPKLYFISHAHHDHLDLKILDKLTEKDALVLEKTAFQTLAKHLKQSEETLKKLYPLLVVEPLQSFTEQDLLKSFGIQKLFCGQSTDEGVSFSLLTQEGNLFYHAGDLNAWNWQDETPEEDGLVGTQRQYLEFLEKHFEQWLSWAEQGLLKQFPFACIPLDQRLEETAIEGMLFWGRLWKKYKALHSLKPLLVPIHNHGGLQLPAIVQEQFEQEHISLQVSKVLESGEYVM